MQLSKNFSLSELCFSQSAVSKGIDNTPSQEVIDNLTNLVKNILQPLRDITGKPITINSGYRSVKLNKSIGGSPTSEHCFGYAADIEIFGLDNKELFNIIRKNFKFTQLILEFYEEGVANSGWVHVSYNPSDLKCQCLVATKVNGKVLYKKV